ncbi:hypothetical protein EUZ85_20030 [Hahella sp. KA22]|uniref:substrate-binding domain-containing protein n=1 Tax=Hahella sp. KA22 TaxID=1628392 RepID=UPI000FDE181D|nr:substrate-binding domain-containing protein [Hahella sp. KA22]AZZ92890.1 hypothetical protein ENC22_17450 [Hahella sp. KA22]QAY56264.1 hypothetical protein EUZ85_20030 [Hahella sp. KA22]
MRYLLPVIALLLTTCCVQAESHAANASSLKWNGPTTGPAAQRNKNIVFVSQDSNNGGISSLYRHFQLAAQQLGWKLEHIDSKNNLHSAKSAVLQAGHANVDAIVLGGVSLSSLRDEARIVKRKGIILLGWHAAAEPGPTDELFNNIATPSFAVAQMAAQYVVQHSEGKVGVVIFNDARFEVANAKTESMRKIISQCDRCRVLSIENISLGQTVTEIPKAVDRLVTEFGDAWTHSLAINDLYFDSISFPLRKHNRTDIRNISAGDGSFQALNRIRSGLSTQVATVAEPAGVQGWQLADELNRAFAGAPPSGYVTEPLLITYESVHKTDIYNLGGDIPYREWYEIIWFGAPLPPAQ